jgi:hypothetical protein
MLTTVKHHALLAALTLLLPVTAQSAPTPCRIEVVEKDSGWPVPRVELRTPHGVSFFSDNAGVIAFDLPEMTGRNVWFEVSADGYEVPRDGLGFNGVRLKPEPGGTLRVEVQRTSLAKCLGRLTGAGLFAESQKTGTETAWKESGVAGCDSVQLAPYGGKLFWLWGDTILPDRALGLFHCSGATTEVRPFPSFDPTLRPDFDLFRDSDGRPRNIAQMPGDGPTWLTGMVSLPDKDGRERLGATYMKVRTLDDIYEWGLALWDGENFRAHRTIWNKSAESPQPPAMPLGHAVRWTDESGREWMLFGHPFPTLRCPATFEAWSDPAQWETLPKTPPLQAADGSGEVKPADGPHAGAIAWSGYRKKWIAVVQQTDGAPSKAGEIWYAEAASPFGPWSPAVKVLSHRRHTLYNVRLHPELTDENAPFILFEGTYTAMFSDGATPTPRHEYNQVLYRLDLDDPGLAPAQTTKN